ncbi:MAG TPA: cytochrome c [Thermoanaerobaculia bacterium]|jgi:mono/diheme cytochrome c family protein|nr:cytochrome c [Thermoanaerobaculia bacterium]
MNRKLFAILTGAVLIILPATLSAADGAALYKAKCAMCHGADGSGATPMGKSMKLRDLRSPEVQKQTDAELIKVTTDGKGKMPAYKGKLTDAEISAIVAHIRTLK